MSNTFISYSRENESIAEFLVKDIKDLGHTVWFDDELSGGEEWWQKILHSIRDCDIFIFALSNNSLNSTACSLEYKYANALGKTIIPVLVGEEVSPNLLPPALSKIQFIDYRERDRDAVLHLAKAFTTAPSSSALPDPLPQAPEIPLSYLGGFVNQINTTSKLNYDEQIVLVAKLKQSLKDPESTHDAQKLLKSLRKRRDILANIAEEIDELLKNASNKHTLRPDNAKVNKNNGQGSKNKPFWKSQFAIYGIIVAVMIGLSNLNIDEEEKLDNQPVTVFQQPNITKDTKTVIDTTIPKITNTNDDIKDADAWFNKGFGLFSLKRYKEAVAAYDKVIAIDPNDVAAINNKGLALQNLKRYDEAIAAYNKAIVINPNYALAFYNKGVVLSDLKRYKEAIVTYDKAITIDPNYVAAINRKGIALQNLKRYDEAIVAYDKVITIDPDYFYAFYNKGIVLHEIKLYDEAIAAYDKALAIEPNNVSAINNKGLTLENLKRYDEAIAAYNKAIAIDPNYVMAINNKGLVMYKTKRYDEAILAYDKVIAITPNNADPFYNKGLALTALKHYGKAILAYDKVVTINPKDFEAYYNLAYLYTLQSNKKMFLTNLEKAIKGDNKYKNMAKENKNFKNYWKDKDFKKLVN